MADLSAIADRIRSGIEVVNDPWPHGTLDDFFPQDVFADLVSGLDSMKWDNVAREVRKAKALPESVSEVINDASINEAIRERHEFTGGKPQVEIVWRNVPLAPHCDRKDKLWNGQVYLAGDPKGTELFDAAGKLVRVIEWKPNRLACWTIPPNKEKHAAPASKGRFVLLWWILKTR